MPEGRAPAAGYQRQDEAGLAATLARVPALRDRLGDGPEHWTVREVGDGNLNLVFVIKGRCGGLVAKQALPFVRMVGESWPLPLSRSHYEHMALSEQSRVCPGLTPAILHRDEALAMTAMELLEPHVIMRRGLMAGTVYPRFAEAAATFLARSLFFTSDLALTGADKKARLAAFAGNTAMCKITEDLVFTEPYFAAPNNRWTTPDLDGAAAALRADEELKAAAARLKYAFLTRTEAMLHGDLHTGAIMVTPEDTRVIDSEFAFYGPMGFDAGMLMGNLYLSAYSQAGHEARPAERDDYVRWILHTIEAVWEGFCHRFLELWRAHGTGDAFAAALFPENGDKQALEAARRAFLAAMLTDALGFAGLEMIRRIVGLSHVIDLESIADPGRRAACEARALAFGRQLILRAAGFGGIRAVNELYLRSMQGRRGPAADR